MTHRLSNIICIFWQTRRSCFETVPQMFRLRVKALIHDIVLKLIEFIFSWGAWIGGQINGIAVGARGEENGIV